MSSVRLGILASDARSGSVLRKAAGDCPQVSEARLLTDWQVLDFEVLMQRLGDFDPQVVLVHLGAGNGHLGILPKLSERLKEGRLLATSDSNAPELIIKAVQMGAREFLPSPVSAQELGQALLRYQKQTAPVPEAREKGQIYGVASAKGGCGVTSVAVNLAAAIAQLPSTRVSVLDFGSPIGDAAAYLNLQPRYTVEDALKARQRLDSVMLESLTAEHSKVSVLAGPARFDPSRRHAEERRADLLAVAQETYSHCVVDMGGALTEQALEDAAELEAKLLVVLTPELTTLWRTRQLLEYVAECQPGCDVRLVLNRDQKDREITAKEVQSILKRKIDWRLPNDYQCCIEAIHAGQPLVQSNHTRLAGSYGRMAQDLTGLKPERSKRRLFGFFK